MNFSSAAGLCAFLSVVQQQQQQCQRGMLVRARSGNCRRHTRMVFQRVGLVRLFQLLLRRRRRNLRAVSADGPAPVRHVAAKSYPQRVVEFGLFHHRVLSFRVCGVGLASREMMGWSLSLSGGRRSGEDGVSLGQSGSSIARQMARQQGTSVRLEKPEGLCAIPPAGLGQSVGAERADDGRRGVARVHEPTYRVPGAR